MLARLEHETRDHHTAAEADRFSVLDEPTLAGYGRFLAAVYHFEYAVESQLVFADDLPIRFVLSSLRTGLLGDDLLSLGSHAGATSLFARPIDRPRFRDALEAFGWIYVVQRNTLQHAALLRALAPHLRGRMQIASRYLTANANNVHERWHELGARLDVAAASPEHGTRIVEAARRAFGQQHAWFVEAGRPTTIHVAPARRA